jgi:hypothetical protein
MLQGQIGEGAADIHGETRFGVGRRHPILGAVEGGAVNRGAASVARWHAGTARAI